MREESTTPVPSGPAARSPSASAATASSQPSGRIAPFSRSSGRSSRVGASISSKP